MSDITSKVERFNTGRDPVRLALKRSDVFRTVGGRTLSQQRVALGARADGTLAALIHTGTTAVVSHNALKSALGASTGSAQDSLTQTADLSLIAPVFRRLGEHHEK